MAKVRAFDAAMLPRNLQRASDPFNDPGITRESKTITSMTPSESAGLDPGKVKVTFSDGTNALYDQVVISHGTNSGGGTPAGALKIADGMFAEGLTLVPVVVNGKVVALESINPPGAVRVLGAAMWNFGWAKYIPESAVVAGREARSVYLDALATQALTAPRDSPLPPLIHNVGQQIPGANANIK